MTTVVTIGPVVNKVIQKWNFKKVFVHLNRLKQVFETSGRNKCLLKAYYECKCSNFVKLLKLNFI